MAKHSTSENVQIVVALIGLVGVVSAALIMTSPRKVDVGESSEQAIEEPIVVKSAEQVAPTKSVTLTGVIIGKADKETFVKEALTRFDPRDEVAITVRYHADESVSNFPVRMSARVFSIFLNGVRESTTDISHAGDSAWTFRFHPDHAWVGQQFVSIQIDGHDEYSQEFEVAEK